MTIFKENYCLPEQIQTSFPVRASASNFIINGHCLEKKKLATVNFET